MLDTQDLKYTRTAVIIHTLQVI